MWLPYISDTKRSIYFLIVFSNCNQSYSSLWFSLFLLGEREYYKKQFATLRSFEEVDSLESSQQDNKEQDLQEQTQHERAMKISNWANIFLLAFKVTIYPLFSCVYIILLTLLQLYKVCQCSIDGSFKYIFRNIIFTGTTETYILSCSNFCFICRNYCFDN